MKRFKEIMRLFILFFKIGLFTFGGGYAMIALLEREFVTKREWLDNNEFIDIVAISESTPGPIAINMATHIGYKRCKFWGSLMSTIGVCLPSFIIIYIISLFFDQFVQLKFVSYAFKGIQVCVIYLILSTGIKMLMKLKKTAFNIILLSLTIIMMILFSLFSIKFSTVFYILIGGFLGYILFLINNLISKKKEKNTKGNDVP